MLMLSVSLSPSPVEVAHAAQTAYAVGDARAADLEALLVLEDGLPRRRHSRLCQQTARQHTPQTALL